MRFFFFFVFILALVLSGCSKHDAPSPKSNFQKMIGTWHIVKDSLLFYDYQDKVVVPFDTLKFTSADYVKFNSDSTIQLATANAIQGMNAIYYSQYVGGSGTIDLLSMTGKFYASKSDSAFDIRTQTVPVDKNVTTTFYPSLTISNIWIFGVNYAVISISDKRLVLWTAQIVLKYPHDYSIEEYIILQR